MSGFSGMDARPDLESLARAAHEVANEWNLTLEQPYARSNYSYVAPVNADAVLKVRAADDDESDEEADALALWDGDGAPRLVRSDRERRAILIERAMPGNDIAGLSEEEATSIAVQVALRLWRPAGQPFRWIGDHVPKWLAEAERSGQDEGKLIPLARELYESLVPGRSALVHGDLHHHNILDAGDRFVAIDPKPMLGEPEFDVPPFLWNPIPYEMTAGVTRRRLAAFAAAGLNEERMHAWAVIRGAYLGANESEAAVLAALVR
jgi:streptomycin 6-kinase